MLRKSAIFIFLLSVAWYPFKVQASTTSANLREQFKEARLEKKEAISQARENFQQKLAAIKDERKKAVVDRIDKRIANANKNLTSKMTNALNRLSNILDKLDKRAQTLKTEGKDVASYDTAAASARTAIASATAAVNAQSAKTYTAVITSDSALKANIGAVISLFRTELSAVHKAVIDAKQAVVKAAKEITKIKTGSKNATGSATIE